LLRAAEVVPDLARAVSLANQSIALDSAAAGSAAGLCRMCDALLVLAHRYEWADSSAAAERALRRWIALRPDDFGPWSHLADLLIGLGRRAEATAAWQRSESLGQPAGDPTDWNLATSLRYDDFTAVDSLCTVGLATPTLSEFESRRWHCAIGLRMEGRYGEALALVREGRVPGTTIVRRDAVPNDLFAAVVSMETGHPLAAAEVFRARAMILAKSGDPDATRARNTAWFLTLAATGAVAGGDTLGARRLIDTIQTVGRQSGFARDPLLHHFVRGILFSREHQDELAARELRASIASPTYGYSRANYELGRTLLALHRPTEAIPVVRAALQGGIEGPGLYVTRTELHELLAQLFDAAGRRDSAHVHYAVVEQAWRSADPFLRPRYEATRRWLAQAGTTSHQ
jgi:tetratricopeptide (TPR) repeat protein